MNHFFFLFSIFEVVVVSQQTAPVFTTLPGRGKWLALSKDRAQSSFPCQFFATTKVFGSLLGQSRKILNVQPLQSLVSDPSTNVVGVAFLQHPSLASKLFIVLAGSDGSINFGVASSCNATVLLAPELTLQVAGQSILSLASVSDKAAVFLSNTSLITIGFVQSVSGLQPGIVVSQLLPVTDQPIFAAAPGKDRSWLLLSANELSTISASYTGVVSSFKKGMQDAKNITATMLSSFNLGYIPSTETSSWGGTMIGFTSVQSIGEGNVLNWSYVYYCFSFFIR